MAQATEQNTTSAPRVDTSAAACRSFNMECDIFDVARMAKIAELMLHDLIGETEFNGTEVVRHQLTSEGIGRAQFAVSHVAKLIEAFQEKFFAGSGALTEH